MNMSTASLKVSREAHKAKRRSAQEETAKNASLLKKAMKEGALESRILTHNGFIGVLYALVMFLVFYMSLQLAFYFVAFLAGSTGSYLMTSSSDVLTTYVILAIVCGFDLFFSLAIEKALIRAMKRRFWKKDRVNGGIDKGDAWRERHPEGSEDNNGAA